jgi:hypothetical protein
MAQHPLAFRSAILPPYVVTLFIAMVSGVGGLLLRHGLAVDWATVVVRSWWVAIVIFVLILAAVVLFRVYVSAEGLRCYTFLGNYHTLRWPEIDSVRPVNLLGLQYLRVGSSQTGHVVWVPVFLADMSRFRDVVRQFAGEEHIVSKALA